VRAGVSAAGPGGPEGFLAAGFTGGGKRWRARAHHKARSAKLAVRKGPFEFPIRPIRRSAALFTEAYGPPGVRALTRARWWLRASDLTDAAYILYRTAPMGCL